jgi:hypothetical protein
MLMLHPPLAPGPAKNLAKKVDRRIAAARSLPPQRLGQYVVRAQVQTAASWPLSPV